MAQPSLNKTTIKQAARRLLLLELAMAVILFVAAGTLSWTRASIFLLLWLLCILVLSADMALNMPAPFARRLNAGPAAEQRPEQKRIQAFNSLLFAALLVLPGLDFRFGWSNLPPALIAFGYGLMILGFLMVDLVFRANEFAGSTVFISADQSVIETGPYGIVRHPMYSGTLLIALGTALALGSAWSCLLIIPITFGLGWRLIDEERMLRQELPGYAPYGEKVRARLIPGIW